MGQQVSKRLQTELMTLMMTSDKGVCVRGSHLQTQTRIPSRVPIPISHSQVFDPLLPSQCGQPRQHLPGHPEREVVCSVRGPNYPVVNPVSARGAQQRQPSQHSRRGTLVQSGGIQEVFVRKVRKRYQIRLKTAGSRKNFSLLITFCSFVTTDFCIMFFLTND